MPVKGDIKRPRPFPVCTIRMQCMSLLSGTVFFFPSPLISTVQTWKPFVLFYRSVIFVEKIVPHSLLNLKFYSARNLGMSVDWDKEQLFWTWSGTVLFQLYSQWSRMSIWFILHEITSTKKKEKNAVSWVFVLLSAGLFLT